MTLNQATGNTAVKEDQTKQIFTFFVEDMMFGLDVDNVLMLDQDISEIQRLPVDEPGLQGVTKFQGVVVPVLDFAHRIGVPSGMDVKQSVLAALDKFEKAHADLLSDLEQAIKSDAYFNRHPDLKSCELTHWKQSFKTRDETLTELIVAFAEPHTRLHDLVEELLSMRDQGQAEQALELLSRERMTSLRRLNSLFSRVRDQIESAMRQVLLFVTLDGKTPLYALVIDEINDVLEYQVSDFHASSDGALKQIMKIDEVIDGVFTRADTADCIYFDIQKIVDVEKLGV